jgi:hypothetical protein
MTKLSGGVKMLTGKFPHHPDYVYHGTSDKNLDSISKTGLKKGAYISTHPMTAFGEAQNSVGGDKHSNKKGVGGSPVVLAIPKTNLKNHTFSVDKEYDAGRADWGRAAIVNKPIPAASLGKSMHYKDAVAHEAQLKEAD